MFHFIFLPHHSCCEIRSEPLVLPRGSGRIWKQEMNLNRGREIGRGGSVGEGRADAEELKKRNAHCQQACVACDWPSGLGKQPRDRLKAIATRAKSILLGALAKGC